MLLPNDCFQHIAGLGNVREINLCLDAFGLRPAGAGSLAASRAISRSAKVGADLLRLVLFQRAGMRLLLGDADFGQHIENRLALDFQFSRQIVDSNLTHPPLCSSNPVPLSLHFNLTDSTYSFGSTDSTGSYSTAPESSGCSFSSAACNSEFSGASAPPASSLAASGSVSGAGASPSFSGRATASPPSKPAK